MTLHKQIKEILIGHEKDTCGRIYEVDFLTSKIITAIDREMTDLEVEHDLQGTIFWSNEEDNMFKVGISSTKYEFVKRLK